MNSPQNPDLIIENSTKWSISIYELLHKHFIRQVVYVPDSGHSSLINQCHRDRTIETFVMSTEEEGVAHLSGAWLGGDRGLMLMQSSGVGNCVNMFSLITECRIPFVTFITMRGQWGEFNPWQVQMGQNTHEILSLSGFVVHTIDNPEDVVETIDAGLKLAFDSSRAIAVLLSQRLIGRKEFVEK